MLHSILLVDYLEINRAGLSALIGASLSNAKVIAEAGDGLEAIKMASEYRPDIIILEILLPKMNGISVIDEILKVSPNSKIIMTTSLYRSTYIRAALGRGAHGYLLKSSPPEILILAIAAVLENNLFLDPAISKCIIRDWLISKNSKERSESNHLNSLTNREQIILKLLAEGYSNKEIGAMLYISQKTVEVHKIHIMQKIDGRNTADLVRFAIREGIIEL